jgi:two-component system sensor histidine kinase UhpB
MKQKLRILLIEDSEDDAVFILRELKRGGYDPEFQRVETADSFSAALKGEKWDAVIADYNLPEFSGTQALALMQRAGLDLPFIIVSGAVGEEVAVAMMKSGAHDYILKRELARLVPAVEREVRDAKVRRERRHAVACVASLSKLGQNLAACSTPEDAARVIGNIADELFVWDAFSLDLYDAEKKTIQTVLNIDTVNGQRCDVPSTYTNENPSGMARRVIDSGAQLILKTDSAPMLRDAIPIGDTSRPSASIMYVPIRNQTKVIGILSIHSYQAGVFDNDTLATFQTLADYCGGALERMRAREELRESREQLRALAAHLQSVREEERKRIAREIHDELGQSLTGLKMDLAWIRVRLQAGDSAANRQPIYDKLNLMGAVLDGTASLVRKLCTELRPGVLDDLGLTAAIEWQAKEFEKRTGIACKTSLELGELAVDPDRSTGLFRIFQEILTNVARHAKATRVDVSLRPGDGFLQMEVADNGRGIAEREKAGTKSLGLLGMRERAHILGGQVEIRGTPGRGTTVTVKIPFPGVSLKNSQNAASPDPALRKKLLNR